MLKYPLIKRYFYYKVLFLKFDFYQELAKLECLECSVL